MEGLDQMATTTTLKADDREGNQKALDKALATFNAEAAKEPQDMEKLIDAGAAVKLYRGRMERMDSSAGAEKIRPDVAKATAAMRKAAAIGDVQKAVGLMNGAGEKLPRFVIQFLDDGNVDIKAYRGSRGRGGTFTNADVLDKEPKAEADKATS